MKSRRVLFVVNRAQVDGPGRDAIDTVLPGVAVTVSENLVEPASFDLVVLWFYQKILTDIDRYGNIVLFHASALPVGRGMAPIYYTFADDLPTCTICAIRAVNRVDEGDILGRATFTIDPALTAPALRAIVSDVALEMTAELLCRDLTIAEPQSGTSTYHRRRMPADNEIDITAKLEDLMPHLRGCEPAHPAFTYYRGIKYLLTVEPAARAKPPLIGYQWIAPRTKLLSLAINDMP